MVKLDIGCGKNKREGFIGVDVIQFDGVDQVVDLRNPWPWDDGAVEEVNCSHFLEHLTMEERVHFFNELYRVLSVGAKALIITPHWSHNRAYGDPTHKWPAVAEFFWYYLDKSWREQNAPHVPLSCDFSVTWGYSIDPAWQIKSQEAQQFAMMHYVNVIHDMIATAVKR